MAEQWEQAWGGLCLGWWGHGKCGVGWLTQECGLQAELQLWTPLLHSGSCGQKIPECGLADKQSTPQTGPPSAGVPAPMGHTGKRNKEDHFAQSLGCRSGWPRTVCGQVSAWLSRWEVEALNLICYWCLWQGFIPENCLKMSFLKHRELVIFSQCLWSDGISNLHIALGASVFLNTNVLWLELLMHRLPSSQELHVCPDSSLLDF